MHSVETGKVVSLGRPKGYEDWLKVDYGIPEHKEVKQLRRRRLQTHPSVFPEVDEVDKKLSKLSFRDKGIGVGFGSIKHWLKKVNFTLHNQLFTSVETLEITTSGGGQHLDSAEPRRV